MSRKKTDVSEEPITDTIEEPVKKKEKEFSLYEVQKGDTIQSIAVKYKQEWEEVAKINGIKEPYNIKKGQVLKVPPLLEI